MGTHPPTTASDIWILDDPCYESLLLTKRRVANWHHWQRAANPDSPRLLFLISTPCMPTMHYDNYALWWKQIYPLNQLVVIFKIKQSFYGKNGRLHRAALTTLCLQLTLVNNLTNVKRDHFLTMFRFITLGVACITLDYFFACLRAHNYHCEPPNVVVTSAHCERTCSKLGLVAY